VFSTPAIGDVNGDGSLDVAYGSFNTKIYVKDRNGRDLPGWPRDNYDTIWSSPAMADIDGNGPKEVLIGTDLGGGNNVLGCPKAARGTMSVFNGAGRFTTGFPKCLDTPIWSTPAVQDINGDGTLDVVVGTGNFTENGANVGQSWMVRAWDTRTGRLLWATPLADGARVFASPAIGDVGGDGSLDIAIGTVATGARGELYLLDAHSGRIKWHVFGAPQRPGCNSCPGFLGSPVIADVDGDGRPDVVAATQEGLYAWNASGNVIIDDLRPRFPDGSVESYQFNNSPAVADLDGDGRNEIVIAGAIRNTNPLRGKVWVVSTPGHGRAPWPIFKRTPDRISSVGAGKGGGATPRPAPMPIVRSPFSTPHSITPSAPTRTLAPSTASPPTPTQNAATSPPVALPPERVPSHRRQSAVVAVAASVLVLSAVALRRRLR
jgi:outer membrane protein assembly factor BamB